MMRSFIKLIWDIDLEALSGSIGFDSDKSKFMISHGTWYMALYEHFKSRKFSNKTGKDYHAEPHDERHEEFNKETFKIKYDNFQFQI